MARTFAASAYLSVTSTPVTAAPLSILAAIFPTTAGVLQNIVTIGQDGSGNNRFALEIGAADNIRALTRTTAGATALSTADVVLNAWNFAAAVFVSSAERHAYVAGGNKGSNTTDAVPTSIDSVYIGANTTGTNPMPGRIGEVGVYNVALSDAEVAAHAGGVSLRLIRPASLVGYWPVWGVASPEPDLSGGGRNMTLTGTPAQADHAPVMPYFWSRPWVPTAAAAAAASYELTDYGFFLPDGVGV